MSLASYTTSTLTQASPFGSILVTQCPSAMLQYNPHCTCGCMSRVCCGCRQLYNTERMQQKVQQEHDWHCDIPSASTVSQEPQQAGKEQQSVAMSEAHVAVDQDSHFQDCSSPFLARLECPFTALGPGPSQLHQSNNSLNMPIPTVQELRQKMNDADLDVRLRSLPVHELLKYSRWHPFASHT